MRDRSRRTAITPVASWRSQSAGRWFRQEAAGIGRDWWRVEEGGGGNGDAVCDHDRWKRQLITHARDIESGRSRRSQSAAAAAAVIPAGSFRLAAAAVRDSRHRSGDADGTITTHGSNSTGILSPSIGGGGGDGGSGSSAGRVWVSNWRQWRQRWQWRPDHCEPERWDRYRLADSVTTYSDHSVGIWRRASAAVAMAAQRNRLRLASA